MFRSGKAVVDDSLDFFLAEVSVVELVKIIFGNVHAGIGKRVFRLRLAILDHLADVAGIGRQTAPHSFDVVAIDKKHAENDCKNED